MSTEDKVKQIADNVCEEIKRAFKHAIVDGEAVLYLTSINGDLNIVALSIEDTKRLLEGK